MVKHQLSAGTAECDISPPLGVSLAGYPHHPRPNEGIHDRLFASCLYLSDGSTRLALVTVDVIAISKANAARIRREASRATGVPERHIMVSCSHSHSSPRVAHSMTMDAYETGTAPDEEYVSIVVGAAVDVVRSAVAGAFSAQIGIAKGFCGRENGVGGNRREPMGLADPEVWTIGVKDSNGTVRAVLVKYSLHPTFLHSDNVLVSADYPGYIRSHFRTAAPDAVFLFALGAAGNQSPRFFRSGKIFAEAERVGTAIAGEAERVLSEMQYRSDLPLTVRSREIELELRKFPPKAEIVDRVESLRRAWHELRDSGAAEPEVWNAELRFLGAEDTLSLMLLHERGELMVLNENTPSEVQVIGIGETRIVALPGELFVEFGIAVQFRAPFANCFVITLANGGLPGYAATARAYAEGGYETGASMLTGRSGEQLVDAAVQLLYDTV
ncbi:MAG: hypothetical protein EA426_09125 [Spirochaetaceae bacterium]|nr:MAG: hypothetical protein EA426_09125 [Spirochaetaceae bacterium]